MRLHADTGTNADYTIIAGCGRVGANLADTLSDEGKDVLVIDRDKSAFRKLSPSFGGLAITGDATDFDVLREAEIDRANVVVAVTDNDNANIMVAQIAREIFGIRRVIARLYDHERECAYQEFGIETICPAILSAKEIDKFLSQKSEINEECEAITL